MSKEMEVTQENLVELKTRVAKMKMPELLAYYNKFEKPVKKFDSHEQAVFNVRGLLDRLAENPEYKYVPDATEVAAAPPAETTVEPRKRGRQALTDEQKVQRDEEKAKAKAALKEDQEKERQEKKAKKDEEKAAKAAAKASPSFRFEPNPNKAPHAVRVGSMVSKMIDLIARPEGATIQELENVSYNTSHSVKSLLNYDLRNQIGYGYYSEDGKTVHILYPEGMSAPLAHAEKPEPKPKEPKAPKPPKPLKEAKAPKVTKGETVTEQPASEQPTV